MSTQYQVAYEGQIITEPMSLEAATWIAALENYDCLEEGSVPAAEVVIAKRTTIKA